MSYIALGLAVPAFYFCVRGAFTSRAQLLKLSDRIGTKNPVIARILCAIGVWFAGSMLGGSVVAVMQSLQKQGYPRPQKFEPATTDETLLLTVLKKAN